MYGIQSRSEEEICVFGLVDKDVKCIVILKCVEIKSGEVNLYAING